VKSVGVKAGLGSIRSYVVYLSWKSECLGNVANSEWPGLRLPLLPFLSSAWSIGLVHFAVMCQGGIDSALILIMMLGSGRVPKNN